ncbi:hypothetical protein MOP88_15595 [Sphingomonas sp. WKB10]|nr:hypothetical protein [Sphingomonas sp. WKB10]
MATGTALTALSMALAAPAFAQTTSAAPADASPPPPQTNPGDIAPDDIMVTGTRIVRDGFKSPTPLTVATQEDILNTSPTNNIADFVNQLPALVGSTRPSNSRLAISSGWPASTRSTCAGWVKSAHWCCSTGAARWDRASPGWSTSTPSRRLW